MEPGSRLPIDMTPHPRSAGQDASRKLRFPLLVLVATIAGLGSAQDSEPVSFRKQIRPILREKCVHCHNRRTLPNEISLESAKRAFVTTPEGQPVIVPGSPEKSLLMRALTSPIVHEKAMPMVGPRPTRGEIKLIRQWIAEGADWPAGLGGLIRPTFYPKE